jgi:acetylornithine deacetylase/succinyl-diaminopimelate desuccinylase-like protein
MTKSRIATALLGVLMLAVGPARGQSAPSADEAAFRDLYTELVETNTTLSEGSCTAAAEAMARRLRAAGLPGAGVRILVPPDRPKSGALIATLPGREGTLKPILLLAHVDVVEAKRDDWEHEPFKLREEGGFFYARGASDDKAMASVLTDSLIRYRREGFVPLRDIRLVLTCGEETPETFNSVKWLLETQPETLQGRFVLNEGATGLLDTAGKPIALEIQAGEKVYQDFALETKHAGGHSAQPVKANAINQLVAGLSRLAAHQFPISVNATTRAFFEQQAVLASPDLAADILAVIGRDPPDAAAAERLWAADPRWNGMLRTTCVTTLIEGGHARNALPQRARANVNCRILPGVPVDDVRAELVRILADDGVTVSLAGELGLAAPVPPLTPRIIEPVRAVAARIWPGVPVIPTMTVGGTDGRYLNAAGIPTYGMTGLFFDAEGSHAHGLNERIRVKSLMDGRRFLYEVVKIYAMQPD